MLDVYLGAGSSSILPLAESLWGVNQDSASQSSGSGAHASLQNADYLPHPVFEELNDYMKPCRYVQ